jgi:TetR/AcrR family transcriptional repressor of nem operon
VAKDTTKLSIIREGARQVHSKGYNNTGLSDILQAASVPKGSFYFYFKSKEDFGLAIIDHYGEFIQGMAEAYLVDSNLPPLDRLANFIDAYQTLFEKMGLRCGCPIGNLIQEMSDLNEPFREKISIIYSRMQSPVEQCLREAQDRGEISADIDAGQAAQFILNSWEGAIMHMKLAKDSQPLKIFRRMVFGRILKP